MCDIFRTVSTILHHSHPYFIYEVIMKWLEHLPRLQKVSGSIPGLGENFSTFVTSVARKSSGQLARKMIVVRPCINA